MNQKSKKILLLISTVITLLICTSYIIAISTGALQLEVVGDVAKISTSTQLSLLILCVLVNLISILFITKDFIKHKKILIFLNVVQILFGTMFNIIFGIMNIFLLCSKTKGIEEIKEKKELPNLEDITKHKWYAYFLIFVFLFIICYTPVINMLPIPNTRIAAIITLVLIYVVQIIALVIPMYNELKRDFVVFKNNFNLYIGNMLPRFGIIFIAYMISSISVMILAGNISNNQELLNSMPLYVTAFLAIIIAPLIEELMFRGFIKKFIKNDILFIISSSLIFGGLHVLTADSLQQFLYIIPYSILGFAFSLNYVKTKNIASNIFLHSVWNSIAVILTSIVG